MDIRDKLHLVIYRVRERGLEVFVRRGEHADDLELPEGNTDFDIAQIRRLREEIIALEQAEDADGVKRGLAIEADYHDIPSLKRLLLDDARRLRQHLQHLPHAEEGSFVAVKEVAKRLLPQQYRLLQELRDILVDRNSTKYM